MRVTQRAIDSEALPWESLSEVLQRKVLNGDPESGPHTLLLRSGPREPGPDFAQYHPIDEELFALDGDFTFDGSTWFGRGSYAFYPAFHVHGANVHVRGGYTVYLRLSGVSELFKVEDPVSDAPYYVGEGQATGAPLQLADTFSDVSLAHGELYALRRSSGGGGSTLLAAAMGDAIDLEAPGLLEVFVLSGAFHLADGAALPQYGYHCEVGDRSQVSLACDTPGTLLISHEGELLLR